MLRTLKSSFKCLAKLNKSGIPNVYFSNSWAVDILFLVFLLLECHLLCLFNIDFQKLIFRNFSHCIIFCPRSFFSELFSLTVSLSQLCLKHPPTLALSRWLPHPQNLLILLIYYILLFCLCLNEHGTVLSLRWWLINAAFSVRAAVSIAAVLLAIIVCYCYNFLLHFS